MLFALARAPRLSAQVGVRHPWADQLCTHLFTPPGWGPAPGINERNVAEIRRVASQQMPIAARRFMDDPRCINTATLVLHKDKAFLNTTTLPQGTPKAARHEGT